MALLACLAIVSPVVAKGQHVAIAGELKVVFLKHPLPDYPYEALANNWRGVGRFRIHLNEQGRVTAVGIVKSTGHPTLDESAIKALLAWQAVPGPKRDVDLPVTFVMSLR